VSFRKPPLIIFLVIFSYLRDNAGLFLPECTVKKRVRTVLWEYPTSVNKVHTYLGDIARKAFGPPETTDLYLVSCQQLILLLQRTKDV
jgi:hypothetical protein